MLIYSPVANSGYQLHRPRSTPPDTPLGFDSISQNSAGLERMTQLEIILKTIKANKLTQQKRQEMPSSWWRTAEPPRPRTRVPIGKMGPGVN